MSAELTEEERDNIAADVYARCMIDLAKEMPNAEGVAGRTWLEGATACMEIRLSPVKAYVALAGPDVKRPRSHLLAQVVSALAHDVGRCDCRAGMVCPAATEVLERCKAQVADRLGAAMVIRSLSVFAKP